VFKRLNKWFSLNVLWLHSDKTNFIHLNTRSTCSLDMKVDYYYRFIANTSYTKFFGITIGNMLYWKSHIDQLLPKLVAACCGVLNTYTHTYSFH
jgi:hypothetical protein